MAEVFVLGVDYWQAEICFHGACAATSEPQAEKKSPPAETGGAKELGFEIYWKLAMAAASEGYTSKTVTSLVTCRIS